MTSLELAMANLASPPVLFFVLGALAVAVRSDLELPQATRRWLALYLLFAIGMKGGVALRSEGLSGAVPMLLAAMVISALGTCGGSRTGESASSTGRMPAGSRRHSTRCGTASARDLQPGETAASALLLVCGGI